MRTKLAVLLVALLAAGCSGGSEQPGLLGGLSGGGIFGGLFGSGPPPSQQAPAPRAGALAPESDASVLLPAVRLAAADRGRQGTILRAEAIAPVQGFHSPQLRVLEGREAGGLVVVELRAIPPTGPEAIGSARSRLLSVGRFFSSREMRDIRGFRVIGAENAISVTAN
ncbi:hypothetical protein BH23PSE1_BH23PSE1_00580 [soil metagenome]